MRRRLCPGRKRESRLRIFLDNLFDDIVNRDIDALDHRGQDETGFDTVLVRIDADDKFVGVALLRPCRIARPRQRRRGPNCRRR